MVDAVIEVADSLLGFTLALMSIAAVVACFGGGGVGY